MTHDPLRYRPEIDGLRAIAVLSVVFFHAKLGPPGGFVGVDIFFVISGYLISALILRDFENAKFSIIEFWERRARRIIPALAVMVAVTLIAGYIFLIPEELKSLGASAFAQSLFIANIYFSRSGEGYFDGPAEEMPLLHTWSLAVEEQFYLVFPLLLSLLFLFPAFRTRKGLIGIFGAMLVGSLVLSQLALKSSPTDSFYLLPSRAWELLVGALLAFVPYHWNPRKKHLRETLSYLGLLLILFALFFYSEGTPFPGLSALVPCLGVFLIIFSNSQIATSNVELVPLTSLGRVLSSKPFVWVGLISYSLYLWHWPILVFLKYLNLDSLPVPLKLLAVALSFGAAYLSYRFVEQTFRQRKLCSSRTAIFAFALGCLVLTAAFGRFTDKENGFPMRYDGFLSSMDNLKDQATSDELSTGSDRIKSDKLPVVGDQDANLPVSILLWGDSHARRVVAALADVSLAEDIGVRARIKPSANPLLDLPSDGKSAKKWQEETFDYIKRNKVKNVVLCARWERHLNTDAEPEFKKALLNTIARLNSVGAKVFIIIQVPNYDVSIPHLLMISRVLHRDPQPYLRTPAEHRKINALFFDMAAENKNPMAVFLDPTSYFLTPDGSAFLVAKDGTPLYSDKHHLTYAAAREYLGKMLKDSLVPQLEAVPEKK